MQGKSLLGQLELTLADLDALGVSLGEVIASRTSSDATRYLLVNAPYSTCAFLVHAGLRKYCRGNFWSGVYRLLRLEGKGLRNNARQVLCSVFPQALGSKGLEGFPQLAETGHKYVTPVLAHAGIPDYCLEDFFERMLLPLVQGKLGADPDEVDEAIKAWSASYRSAFTDKPVRNFLLHGGPIAEDLLLRCVEMFERAFGEPPSEDFSDLDLPPSIIERFLLWKQDRKAERIRGGVRYRKPLIVLDTIDRNFYLLLQPQILPVDNGPVYRWLITIDGSQSKSLKANFVRYIERERYGETAELRVPLQNPPRVIKADIIKEGEEEPVRNWEIRFTPDDGPMQTCLALKEVVNSELLFFVGDSTIKDETPWIVKPRRVKLASDTRVISRIDRLSGGWSEHEAIQVETQPSQNLRFVDEETETAFEIPVRYSILNKARLGARGLVEGVSAGGNAVYSLPPVLQLPQMDDIDRFSLVLAASGESSRPETKTLGELAQRVRSRTSIPLESFPSFDPSAPGHYSLSIKGQLGERSQFQFLYHPGLKIEFSQRYYINRPGDDSERRVSFHLSSKIKACPVVEEAIRVDPLGEDGGWKVELPEGSHTFRLFWPESVWHDLPPLEVRAPVTRFRLDGIETEEGRPETELSTWRTKGMEVSLESMAPDAKLYIQIPFACEKAALRMDGGGKTVESPVVQGRAVFPLGYLIRSYKSERAIFRVELLLKDESGSPITMPVLTVKRNWAVEVLEHRVRGHPGKAHLFLRWNEQAMLSEGEIVMRNLHRPWEEPSIVTVAPDATSAQIPFPGGSAAPGEYLVCFSLTDEWCVPTACLPFQRKALGTTYRFSLEERLATAQGRPTIYDELGMATRVLLEASDPCAERRPFPKITLNLRLSEDERAEVRACVVSLVYWRMFLRRRSEFHDALIILLRDWRAKEGNEDMMREIYHELKAVGGLEVAREIDALDLLFKEEFEVPFRPGDYLRKKDNKQVFKYIGINDEIRSPIKMLVFYNLSKDHKHYFLPDDLNLFENISQAEAEAATQKRGGRRGRPWGNR